MVLPFRNLNGPGEDYFADAVTDDLTTDLSRLSDTMVIARATAFTYKGKAADAREIRREFGVRYEPIEIAGIRVARAERHCCFKRIFCLPEKNQYKGFLL
jgi:TolB-like protein